MNDIYMEETVKEQSPLFYRRYHMFAWMVGFAALFVALVAAFFSVTGIGQLFYGSHISVIIMGTSLEIAKLVAASFLFRYWKHTTNWIKGYLSAAVLVLVIVTSIGIYGYLSSAYSSVAANPANKQGQIALAQAQQTTIKENIVRYQSRITSLEGRRNQQEARIDSLTGRGATRTAREQLRATQLVDSTISALNNDIVRSTNKRDSLETAITTLRSDITSNRDVGTFFYFANALGLPLDTIVKWFILILVCVFDPMSLSLVLAYNTIVRQNEIQKILERNGHSMNSIQPSMFDKLLAFIRSIQTKPIPVIEKPVKVVSHVEKIPTKKKKKPNPTVLKQVVKAIPVETAVVEIPNVIESPRQTQTRVVTAPEWRHPDFDWGAHPELADNAEAMHWRRNKI